MATTSAHSRRRRPPIRLVAVLAAALLAVGLLGSAPASADPAGDGRSSQTEITRAENCSVYANASGMGSYCVTGIGGGTPLPSLRERFGGQDFRPCRYGYRDHETGELISKIPPGMTAPSNKAPEDGDWWLRSCLTGINWNIYDGGRSKHITMHLQWLPNGADTTYEETELSEFMWNQVAASSTFPVPSIRPQPNFVPLVGVPAFFTFDWLDPSTQQPVNDPAGPYADERSGPWIQTRNSAGMLMRASVKNIEINPMQKDMKPVDCGPGNPTYDDSKPPDPKIQGDCYLLFERSSASARKFSTKEMWKYHDDLYALRITVTWKVMYGPDEDHLGELGDGFESVSYQKLPVQEVQVPNIPPVMIF